MCGLTGCVFNNVINFDHKQFKKINDLISHRGPDYKDTSFFKSADKNVYFGHNRLSIIDLNKTGNQPMESQNNRFTIIFNGEIYNHKELRDFLISNYNIIFKGTSDTEILLEYFVKSNIHSFFDKIEGMFSFVFVDTKLNKIFCARDHFGQKPFFYYFKDGNFIFSSELTSLISNPIIKKEICVESICNYLHYDSFVNNSTPIKNCYKLLPSEYLIYSIEDNSIVKDNYWKLNDSTKIDTTGQFVVPVGTTAQRPSSSATATVPAAAVGAIRYNSTDTKYEFVTSGTTWENIPAESFSVAMAIALG